MPHSCLMASLIVRLGPLAVWHDLTVWEPASNHPAFRYPLPAPTLPAGPLLPDRYRRRPPETSMPARTATSFTLPSSASRSPLELRAGAGELLDLAGDGAAII